MPTIPNFPQDLADLHHAWHKPVDHPTLPTRRILPPNPGAGLEFLEFHRDFVLKFHQWYDSQPFADQNAVAPWTSIPPELKVAEAGWNSRWEADENRIATNNPRFASADELGLFIELGIHNSFIHFASSMIFDRKIVKGFHSPESTLFYKIHGLIDFWWTQWTLRSWKHGAPSAGLEVKVAPGTSPTSWYTKPENVQHIAFVGNDQQIHECFFKTGVDHKWSHSLPSDGETKVMLGTSPTSWYTTPENVQHIAYVGIDQQIHECFFKIGVDQKWGHSVPSAGKTKVRPGTSPTSWYTTPENIQHIAYVDIDGQIHECFFKTGVDVKWRDSVPSAVQEVKVAPGTSPTSWYTTPENVQHIAYVGTDQQIHECFFKTGVDHEWSHSVPSAGKTKVRPGTSPTSWYTTPEKVQHIAYVDIDGQIDQCFFFIGGFGGWRHEVTSAGKTKVMPGTSPTSWYTTPENVQHIAYVDIDQQIHELFFFVRVGGDFIWHESIPSAGQDVKVAPGTSPTSWYTTPENIQHIAYVGSTDQQIHECFFIL